MQQITPQDQPSLKTEVKRTENHSRFIFNQLIVLLSPSDGELRMLDVYTRFGWLLQILVPVTAQNSFSLIYHTVRRQMGRDFFCWSCNSMCSLISCSYRAAVYKCSPVTCSGTFLTTVSVFSVHHLNPYSWFCWFVTDGKSWSYSSRIIDINIHVAHFMKPNTQSNSLHKVSHGNEMKRRADDAFLLLCRLAPSFVFTLCPSPWRTYNNK